ncbi:FAD-dependent monooxygenase (plasmid) [Sphingobium sp. SJ10-10]|uniref:FAD-dependent monooxygenase n=1 Tax=unclassified Sphingobium TaxID=2611147 RepID=UPI0007700CA4|nr:MULTISPECIES: FAD-dependent monooxygenase [unclassified Sphingobium]AMK26522.1 hypothetical protein K426_28115 [Sphingobium sp. TKS]MEC6699547.1 FAD-dependent monooxygenase [Sphingobium sp. SJ10-10]
MIDAPVLIAGGGPVGMTLALVLAHHGVQSIIVERNENTTTYPKMDLTNGRSMELFRTLGIVDKLRAVGVPPDQPLDVVWATSLSGHVLHRFAYPTPDEKRATAIATDDGTDTAEPSMRVSQVILEPVLKKAIDENPLIDVRFGWALEGLEQDEDGVTATVRSKSGETVALRSQYLAGCDGGGSTVRRRIGVESEGQPAVIRMYMIHFKSRDHAVIARFGAAYHFQTVSGSLIIQDGVETWTVQMPLPPGTDESSLDPAKKLRQWVGQDFDFEIVLANPWSAHQIIAERYIVDRVILAGDAAHQVIPTGGYGMNTGIGDAFDLGWKLAAMVNGWGGPALLPSYETERQQIAIQNRAATRRHAEVRVKIRDLILKAEANQEGGLDSPDGAGTRDNLGAAIKALGNAENESWGIEHGYRYANSPVIVPEMGVAPLFDPVRCTPTTWPGSRLPLIYLGEGHPLYDDLGLELTLLVSDGGDPAPFVAAAEGLAVPLSTLMVTQESAIRMLEKRFVLVRPDHHVAWRGDVIPDDAKSILEQVTGR